MPHKTVKLSSLFRYNASALRLFGLFPKSEHYTINYKIYRYTLLCFSAISTVLKFYNLRYIYNDLLLATTSLNILFSEINLMMKSSFIMRNHRLLKKMLKQLEQDRFQPQTANECKTINSFIRIWKLLTITYISDGALTVLLWSVYPLIDNSGNVRRLPFVSWFPYDYRKTPYYQLTYIYQLLAVYYFSFSHMFIDASVAYILTMTSGQCALLSMKLEEIYEITEDRLIKNGRISKNSNECQTIILNEMHKTLKDLIVYHKEILEFAENGNKFINPIASVQLVKTVLVLCATMFQMTLVALFSSEFWSLITYQIALTFQILLYCWFGDQVLTQSRKISFAIYKCKWLEVSNNFKKDMMFFMQRTQKPIKFEAMNFFTLSLPTFSSVIQTSWSYFTMLRTVQKSN